MILTVLFFHRRSGIYLNRALLRRLRLLGLLDPHRDGASSPKVAAAFAYLYVGTGFAPQQPAEAARRRDRAANRSRAEKSEPERRRLRRITEQVTAEADSALAGRSPRRICRWRPSSEATRRRRFWMMSMKNLFEHIGRYFVLMGKVFSKPEKMASIYRQAHPGGGRRTSG